jgi:hypothetical protein
MVHAAGYVAAAVVIAIAASGLALFLANGATGRPPLIVSAAALGCAISGMHYTAMAGVTIWPHEEITSTAPALSTDLLAIVVAVVAFGVSGIFLLILVPERLAERAGRSEEAGAGPAAPAEAPGRAGPAAGDRKTHAAVAAAAPPADASGALNGADAITAPARLLPVLREGASSFIAVKDIAAVHANAHYTYVFDGRAKLFCPLSIGEVQSRLDAAHFVRVHRSHIVNIERVVGLKRTGDQGLIELEGHDPYTVPVSRSRYGGLKTQLGLRPREAVARGALI